MLEWRNLDSAKAKRDKLGALMSEWALILGCLNG